METNVILTVFCPSGSSDQKVMTWYMDDLSLLSVISDITSPVLAVALSVDNTFLLVSKYMHCILPSGLSHILSFSLKRCQ